MKNCNECADCKKFTASNRPCKDGIFRCKSCAHKRQNKKWIEKYGPYQLSEEQKAIKIRRAVKWNKENKERRDEIVAKYRTTEKFKEGAKRRSRKRYWADPEYHRIKAIARNHGLEADFVKDLFQRQPTCQLCGTEERKSVDHIIAVNKGGTSEKKNLMTLCVPCNAFKGDRFLLVNAAGIMI